MNELLLVLLSITEGFLIGVPIYQLLKTKKHYKINICLIVIGLILFLGQVILTKNL